MNGDSSSVHKEEQVSENTMLFPVTVGQKTNQLGNPNPAVEVIALSPRSLTATNRFVCEVCQKGFKREQNLQLHRRGHNLPWKLKTRNPNEAGRKKVYVCPEPTCVHHHPSRALGDATGIKKHFLRRHGEKRFHCPRCNKRYAVHSDWKAHSKTCGFKVYKCNCGTNFSRRDSFVSHKKYCDALSQQTSSTIGGYSFGASGSTSLGFSFVVSHISTASPYSNPMLSTNRTLHVGNSIGHSSGSAFRSVQTMPPPSMLIRAPNQGRYEYDNPYQFTDPVQIVPYIFTTPNYTPSGSTFFNANIFSNRPIERSNKYGGDGMGIFSTNPCHYTTGIYHNSMAPAMSASALYQKATQLVLSPSNSITSLLRNFGSPSSNETTKCGRNVQFV